MMAPDVPSAALRPLLCLGVAALAVVAAPSWANPAGEAEKPAIAATPAVLPYGAGYEQRMRAARSAAQSLPSVPASAPAKTEPVRNSGFGRAGTGSGSQGGSNSGRGGRGR